MSMSMNKVAKVLSVNQKINTLTHDSADPSCMIYVPVFLNFMNQNNKYEKR